MLNRAVPLLMLSCSVLLGGCHQPKPTPTTFNWKGPVQADGWLRLRNVSGDFDIGVTDGDSAEISFVIERSSVFAPDAQIKVLKTADGVLACVMYAADGTCSPSAYNGGNTYSKSFFSFRRGGTSARGTILLPRGVKLDVESTNGDISVSAATSDIVATATNGDVDVRGAHESVQVTTTNGDIEIGMDSVAAKVAAESTNGDVRVLVPPTLSAAVTMNTTNGELSLDLPGTIATKTAKQIVATLGRGAGSPITISTVNGDITVRSQTRP
jgi:Putative adhesin